MYESYLSHGQLLSTSVTGVPHQSWWKAGIFDYLNNLKWVASSEKKYVWRSGCANVGRVCSVGRVAVLTSEISLALILTAE
jgi:hypothetical protein